MSEQPGLAELPQDGNPAFSEKIMIRLSATPTDCGLVSSDGMSYPVHKAKLMEQSSVLRQASNSRCYYCSSNAMMYNMA